MKKMWMIYRLHPLSLSSGKEKNHFYLIPKEGRFSSESKALERMEELATEDKADLDRVTQDPERQRRKLLYMVSPYYEKL